MPSFIPWLVDPQLFLYSQGGVAQIWRCKKTNSESEPMKLNIDFEYVVDVKNHLDLVMYNWKQSCYQDLIDYISERRLLVNGQGLVIMEFYEFGEDGKIDDKELPTYIWSLDVLPLHTYIEGLPERQTPFRTIKYLEDGRAVPMESSPKELKLKADLEKEKNEKQAREKEVADLKTKKNTLEDQIRKLTAELDTKTDKVTSLEQEMNRVKREMEKTIADLKTSNKILEGQVTKLTADIAAETKKALAVQQELNQANSEKRSLERKVKELQDQNNNLINSGQGQGSSSGGSNEPWMNGRSDNYNWVSVAELSVVKHPGTTITVGGLEGHYSEEYYSTNVRASYFRSFQFHFPSRTNGPIRKKAVVIGDLTPNRQKARFEPRAWTVFEYEGTTYVCG